ncbi:response regulator transcription factor [Halanaerobium praevalens]|uniref:Stage 0 sporulation protein A homolog n=1 Tax=Halanaerobium praevalens (strain ATCC 33744 / DSM 2228 / GSL) TaxID=572479 RepID=E3DN71_HALPG|nr:response regulator transcription factor [Halanaerobium praevalens]ADO76477.1 two component transcriptional regulator, winged helix family [Halanaerobium praevalens DSM 2228]
MDKKKILIIDDDLQITKILRDYFNYENFEVFVAHDGQKGLEKINNLEIDIIILDLMLPKKNGLDICRQLKPHNKIPIIILSAKNRENDRIKGLELGADDYVTKPFSPKELVLRVKNVLKRINNDQDQNELSFPDLIINKEQRLVKVKKEEIALAPKEFDLLWQLASSPKTVFSREKLLELVWDFDYFGGIRTVDTHIKSIRNKLGAEVGNYVQTVWGIGYKFGIK